MSKYEPKTILITREAKNNLFIDCTIHGQTEVSGIGTKFIRTKMRSVVDRTEQTKRESR